jgi:4-amino-4-deoxy-L-arabinose transferase-like glycosyltransferase
MRQETKSLPETASEAATLALLLAAILVFRLGALAINNTDLFYDEAQYWAWSREPAFGYFSKPPLIAWIIATSTSLCGHGEACIRAASPFLHTLTAGLVYLVGRKLYDANIGFWSALVFATLPGVSFSASLISTDVPLLVCWTAALLAFVSYLERPAWVTAALLGLAIGAGLNAKYAMLYFVGCAVLYLAITPARRAFLRDPRLWVAVAIAGICILPNILWNTANSFATFEHTAANANWSDDMFQPVRFLEFVIGQFGVFGPIMLLVLFTMTRRAWRNGVEGPERLLFCFSLPVLALICAQALISRAHANWAATGYVAACVLVTAGLIKEPRWDLLKGSLALHVAAGVLLAMGLWLAAMLPWPAKLNPVARMLGWHDLAGAVSRELREARAAGQPYRAVLTDDRASIASLLYYMRGEPTPLHAWRIRGAPHDHFELTRPHTANTPEPILLVSLYQESAGVVRHFSQAKPLKRLDIATGRSGSRPFWLFSLSGFKSR